MHLTFAAIKPLLNSYINIESLPADCYYDYGSDEPFSSLDANLKFKVKSVEGEIPAEHANIYQHQL